MRHTEFMKSQAKAIQELQSSRSPKPHYYQMTHKWKFFDSEVKKDPHFFKISRRYDQEFTNSKWKFKTGEDGVELKLTCRHAVDHRELKHSSAFTNVYLDMLVKSENHYVSTQMNIDIVYEWMVSGAPIFDIGPVMGKELVSYALSYEYRDDFIPSLLATLPFDFFYLSIPEGVSKYEEGHDFEYGELESLQGAYIFKTEVDGTPALGVMVDDGVSLTIYYCESNYEGETRARTNDNYPHIDYLTYGGQRDYLNVYVKSRSYLGTVLTVLDGLIRYLEATNKQVEDPTPTIKAGLTSGNPRKVIKTLRQKVGRRKIWVEPDLERKFRESNISGQKLAEGHVRRGHLHTYYTGSKLDADGNKLPMSQRTKIVRFVAPTWVGPRTVPSTPKYYGVKHHKLTEETNQCPSTD